jgi:hypothetical protein
MFSAKKLMAQIRGAPDHGYNRKGAPARDAIRDLMAHSWGLCTAYFPQVALVYVRLHPTALGEERENLVSIAQEAPDVQEQVGRLLALAQGVDECTTGREPFATERYNALLSALDEIADKGLRLAGRVFNDRARLHIEYMVKAAREGRAAIDNAGGTSHERS